ncbi:SWIM zinc finger family protein [Streptomyces sp. GS7]|uniref:SWIM zinc finger family protein n=1 Tax=Streptomyces sp. GS7 TaxID=2692234 RepID=UPI0013187394|nr:SWF or SNF family helicase [Streptomyces sp. GS7]QHC24341.1 SWF or SNF family helicase [Streptomyces sp. GS7]
MHDDVETDGHGPERTFAALPVARGRAFARSWWGQAWLKALEDTALDGQQLKLGRRHARAGAVGAVSVRPGRVTAVVQDRDHTRHRSDVLLQQLGAADWDRFLDLVTDRAGHIAALLDRDMPPVLVEDAAVAGIELLPVIGDLEPECSCGAWDHCAHSAALCYQVARLLDEDPFVLLLLRGRSEQALLDELQERSAARAGVTTGEVATADAPAGRSGDAPDTTAATGRGSGNGNGNGNAPGVPAAEAYAARDILPPLPAPPPVVTQPGGAPVLGGGTPPAPGVDVAALEFLINDAAARARQLLSDALSPWHPDAPPPPELTPEQDAVRLAADGPGTAMAARLAAGSGRDMRGLARAVRAWELGGPAGLAVLEEDWTPEPEVLARAAERLAAAWEDRGTRPRLRAAGNRWTVLGGDAQLRYGRDGRWWPYRKEAGQWTPAGPATDDPAAALAGMTTPSDGD